MSTAANAEAFAQPHWLVKARGFDVKSWYEKGLAVGTGGIARPEPTRLPAGRRYYRFANSRKLLAEQLGGEWWLDEEGFRTLSNFAQANGYRLREAARLMLALPYDWTAVDRLVTALLRQPLRAYTGYGKVTQGAEDGPDRGTRWVPTQHVKVRQFFIPGLNVAGRKVQLYQTVFEQPMRVTPAD